MRKYPRGPKTPRPKAIRPGVTLLVPDRRRFPPGRHGERKLMTLEKAGNRPRVVVVGAGFAGLYAVRGLKKSGYQVTLIEKNLYSTFQPLLYQVATGGLNPRGGARRRGRLPPPAPRPLPARRADRHRPGPAADHPGRRPPAGL